ncbi:rRNA adenine N-6-methyltransferase family protein [Actinacidiphila glaucinigra]
MVGGRHELGQNFLTDRTVIASIEALVAATSGPIVEIGPGDGALTLPLSRTGRPLTAVEIDPRRAQRLQRRLPRGAHVVNTDVLRYRFPREPHVIVGNLPFHLTTTIMRRVLAADRWDSAVLLVQWEVARRRAGIGGGRPCSPPPGGPGTTSPSTPASRRAPSARRPPSTAACSP